MVAVNQYSDFRRGQSEPYVEAEAVTVDVELTNVSSAIICAVDCSPTVVLLGGTTIQIPLVIAGHPHPCRITKCTDLDTAGTMIAVS